MIPNCPEFIHVFKSIVHRGSLFAGGLVILPKCDKNWFSRNNLPEFELIEMVFKIGEDYFVLTSVLENREFDKKMFAFRVQNNRLLHRVRQLSDLEFNKTFSLVRHASKKYVVVDSLPVKML